MQPAERHHVSRAPRSRRVWKRSLCLLAVAWSAGAGTTHAQRPLANPDALVFIGATGSATPAETLTAEDLTLLIAIRDAAGLGEVLAQGIPFRSSQIQDLTGKGLVAQVGERFRATLPIFVGADVRVLREELAALAPPVVAAIRPAIRELEWALSDLGYPEAMPALTTWLLRQRVWQYLRENGPIALDSLIAGQQDRMPDRGWWGALWYIDPPPSGRQWVVSVAHRERTLMLGWHADHRPADLDIDNPYPRLTQVVQAIRNDDLRIRDADQYQDLINLGLLDPTQERLAVPMIPWDPSDPEGFAAKVDRATAQVAAMLIAQLAGDQLPSSLAGLAPSVAWSIAYCELVPRLLEGLAESGIRALVDPSLAPPVTTIPDPASEADGEPVLIRPWNVSALVMKDLPRDVGTYPLPR